MCGQQTDEEILRTAELTVKKDEVIHIQMKPHDCMFSILNANFHEGVGQGKTCYHALMLLSSYKHTTEQGFQMRYWMYL